MAKNERFDDTITIRIKGRSTNRFVPNIIEQILRDQVKAINSLYQQTDATIEIVQDVKPKKGLFRRGESK
jgi:hypothetical protein